MSKLDNSNWTCERKKTNFYVCTSTTTLSFQQICEWMNELNVAWPPGLWLQWSSVVKLNWGNIFLGSYFRAGNLHEVNLWTLLAGTILLNECFPNGFSVLQLELLMGEFLFTRHHSYRGIVKGPGFKFSSLTSIDAAYSTLKALATTLAVFLLFH